MAAITVIALRAYGYKTETNASWARALTETVRNATLFDFVISTVVCAATVLLLMAACAAVFLSLVILLVKEF